MTNLFFFFLRDKTTPKQKCIRPDIAFPFVHAWVTLDKSLRVHVGQDWLLDISILVCRVQFFLSNSFYFCVRLLSLDIAATVNATLMLAYHTQQLANYTVKRLWSAGNNFPVASRGASTLHFWRNYAITERFSKPKFTQITPGGIRAGRSLQLF